MSKVTAARGVPCSYKVTGRMFARLLTMIKVGDDVALKTYIYKNFFLSWLAPLNASLLFAIAFVTLWLGIMSIFYYKRIFIKL